MEINLLPCAHCGSPAKFGECTDTENFGGQFIECTNLQCGISTCIMFPAMCSVKEDLAERWNLRVENSKTLRTALERVRAGLCYPDEYRQVADEALNGPKTLPIEEENDSAQEWPDVIGSGGDSPSYRASMKDAGRGHLLP